MNVDGSTLLILASFVAALVILLVALDRRSPAEPAVPSHNERQIPRLKRLTAVLIIAAWFGLVTGVFHVTLAVVNRYVRNHFLMVSPQILWLAPTAYVLIFVALAMILGTVVLVSPRFVPPRLAIALFAWLGLFGLLLPFRQLHWSAAAALAAGVAAQVARLMARRPAHWLRIMRRTTLRVSGTIAVLALALAGWRAAAGPLALRRLPEARPSAPNVLLVVMDTVRAANLSLYGYGRSTTPELARWAQGGTTFDLAFSTGPWTLKSHASMFTGLYPHQMGGDFEQPVSTEAPMLAEIFRDQGYATGGFVANLPYTSRESGLARGFLYYDDYQVSPRQLVLHSWIAHTPLFRDIVNSRSPADLITALAPPRVAFEADLFNDRTYGRKSAAQINASFLGWQAAHSERPFFAFLNYFDAHVVYRSPPSFAAAFAMPDRPNMGRYDGAIAYIDHEIGRLFAELQERGVLDNTIVIVTSDHGEQFGEHGLSLHANSLYLPLLRVPLVIRYPPRMARDSRVETPVTLRDLAATVIDLADLAHTARVPGVSLATQSDRPDAVRQGSVILAEVERAIRPSAEWPVFYGPMQTVFDTRFHYIRRGDGFEELYAYRADPSEASNLSTTPEGASELPRLRALMASTFDR